MPIEIIMSAAGEVTPLLDGEGVPWAIRVRDDTALPGRATIVVTGPLGLSGFPATVVVPDGMTHVQTMMLNGNPGPDLLPGAALITPLSVGFPASATSVSFWIRAVDATGQGTGWRKRTLRAEVLDVVPPPVDRMVLTGDITYSTTGQVGQSLAITALPTASRAPSETQVVLRLYSAMTGGTLSSTVSPAPATVPNNDTLFGVPVYRAFDPVYGEWVEMEADARFDISTPAVSPGPVTQADLAITALWKPGGLRQQAVHTFSCAGSPHGTLLEAQIVTNRYTTAWTPCVPQATANVWGFGVAAIPAGQPGAGRNAFEFYDTEDRFKVRFRRRASTAVSWSAVSGNMVFPWPTSGGAEQFNATPTTRQGIIDAIIAGAASGSGRYVIGLAGNIDFAGGTVSVSGRNKPGEPLIIKSISRLAPVVIRGLTDSNQAFSISTSSNMIFDRINIDNDRTRMIGWPAGGVPLAAYPAGQGFRLSGCLRIQITDCLIRSVDVGIETRDCDDVSWTFCEFDRIVQDGWRIYTRNGTILVEGEYQHDPLVYHALAVSNYQPPYHPDDSQASTRVQSEWVRTAGSRMGGNRNVRRIFGRSYGTENSPTYHTAGFWGNEVCRTRDATDTDMETGGARHINQNILWEGMYIETKHDMFPFIECCDGFTIRNSVCRSSNTGTFQPTVTPYNWAKNIVIDNVVAPRAARGVPGDSKSPSKMTAAQLMAQVTGAVTVSKTAWPAGWTGGETRYPTGPDAYR